MFVSQDDSLPGSLSVNGPRYFRGTEISSPPVMDKSLSRAKPAGKLAYVPAIGNDDKALVNGCHKAEFLTEVCKHQGGVMSGTYQGLALSP